MPSRRKPPDARVPDYCDFDCPHAEFPPADTAGICRTMSAVWCGQLRELVNKNAPCEWKRRRAGSLAEDAAADPRVGRRAPPDTDAPPPGRVASRPSRGGRRRKATKGE